MGSSIWEIFKIWLILSVGLLFRPNNNATRWRDFAYDNEVCRYAIYLRIICKYIELVLRFVRFTVILLQAAGADTRSKRDSSFSRISIYSLANLPGYRAACISGIIPTRARKFALYYSREWIAYPAFQLQPIA